MHFKSLWQAMLRRPNETVTEQAVQLHLFREIRTLGLTAVQVPMRVDAGIKLGLCDLLDHAVAYGWSVRRACRIMELHPARASRCRQRRAAGLPLEDAP